MENSKYWDSVQTEITVPPNSGLFVKETLGRSQKRYFQRRKWGSIPRKDSQRVMKQAMWRIEFGVSW
jgi:hypothetical protein